LCKPKKPGLWGRLNETLNFLSSFNCPTAIRITLVEGYNMENIEEYAKIIDKACPTYIETKAYMHIGFSNLRLDYHRMPKYDRIQEFSSNLSKKTGYKIIDQSRDSRVVLLSKREKPIRFN